MYGPEHYISKIERNTNVVDKAPANVKADCISHIKWASELARRLDQLDYAERQTAIDKIHQVMDGDYALMGFTQEKTEAPKVGLN